LLAFGMALLASSSARAERCRDLPGDTEALHTAWAALASTCGCAPAPRESWKREHGDFLDCARGFAVRAVLDQRIRAPCRGTLLRSARRSTCGRPLESTTCCLTNTKDQTSCKVHKLEEHCATTASRSATLGNTETCLDACDDVTDPACSSDTECDDGDSCTLDSCEPAEGCRNVPIAGCVPVPGGGDDGTSCTGTGTSTHGLSAVESTVLQQINDYRSSQGKPPVTACASLSRSAQDHANDMRDRDYFAHVGSDGSEFWERACDAGYAPGCGPLTWMGEIIAGYDSTAEGVMNQWTGSPPHASIMAESNYVVAGIGHACGGSFLNYWVVDFAGTDEPSCR